MGNPVFAADNRLDVDTVTSNAASADGFPIANLFDDRLFTFYKTVSSTAIKIDTDAGVGKTVDVDYITIIGHNLDANANIRFKFEQASDPGGPFTVIIPLTAVSDNKIIFQTFTKVTNRVFRLTIEDTEPALFAASVSQLQWGKRVESDGFIQVLFDPESEEVRGRFTRSQSGNILGAISTISTRFADILIPFVTNTFIRDNTVGGFKDFWDNHASKMKPFVFAWNPGSPGNFEKDAFFCIIQPEAGISRLLSTNLDAGFRSLQFRVEGLKE